MTATAPTIDIDVKALTTSELIALAKEAMARVDAAGVLFGTWQAFFYTKDAEKLPESCRAAGLLAYDAGCEMYERLNALRGRDPYPFKHMKTREVREWLGTSEEKIEALVTEAMEADFTAVCNRFLTLLGHPDTDTRRTIICMGEGWMYHELGKIEQTVIKKIALHRAIERRKAAGEVFDPAKDQPFHRSRAIIQLNGMQAGLEEEF